MNAEVTLTMKEVRDALKTYISGKMPDVSVDHVIIKSHACTVMDITDFDQNMSMFKSREVRHRI